jgi:ech hydrogenase subunit A
MLYWARWAGLLLGTPYEQGSQSAESREWLTRFPLLALSGSGLLLPLLLPLLYSRIMVPLLPGWSEPHMAVLNESISAFGLYPAYLAALTALLLAVLAVRSGANWKRSAPYMSGAAVEGDPTSFEGPFNQPVRAEIGNYYLSQRFGELGLTRWANWCGSALLALIIGAIAWAS